MDILHLSYDYPDKINSNKTVAIKDVINAQVEFTNPFTISLNRTANILKLKIIKENRLISLNTFGLSKGLFFRFTLSNSIKKTLSTKVNFKDFDLIHAHKLTFEGPIAFYLYKKKNIPYIVTIQQTDFKILKFKPLLRKYYYGILCKADKIVIPSPWMKNQLDHFFGRNKMNEIISKIVHIPFIVERKYTYQEVNNHKFLCVFNLNKGNLKIKNIDNILKSIGLLKSQNIMIELDIVGEGSGRKILENRIKKLNLSSQVKLLGKIENSVMTEFMSNYKAFILCSYPETFGMVYIEALSAGIPLIYSKGAGIDGFFKDKGIGLATKHNDISEICKSIKEMNDRSFIYKQNVKKLQDDKELSLFSKEAVTNSFYKILKGNEVIRNE